MKILDRYLLAEMAWPFLGGILTFVVLISGHMLFLAIETMVDHHVPLSGVLRYVAYQIPGALIMALPVATLLAASLALNRLARDHEIIALRSGGMGTARLMAPALLIGLIAAGLSGWLSESLGPRSKQASETLLRDVVLQQRALVFKPYQFLDTGRGITLYAESTDTSRDTVGGLHVFCLRPGASPMLLWAPQAQFGATSLQVPNSRFYTLDINGGLTWGESDSIDIDLTQMGAPSGMQSSGLGDLSLSELRTRWTQALVQGPEGARSFAMEYHTRLAMAFVCLVFALIAGPVTLRFGRGQSLVGVLATILVVFAFYVVMLWLRMLGNSGRLPVLVAAWGESLLLLAVAVVAIRRQR
ncbi:MAG: LptF/LptG family permease [Armatimonadota bacterium]